jgi:alpha-ketoglutarate-dependent taurine dioxygenase
MKYQGKKLSQIDPVEASCATAEHGWIVIEGSNASPEEFAEWYLDTFYTLSPDIWCSDTTHSNLFWRVTNDLVDDKNKGLFANDDVDWHSDLIPEIDSQEVVGLYAKTITYHTETWICSSTKYWKSLSTEIQDWLRSLEVEILNKGSNNKTPFFKPDESQWERGDWDNQYTETVVNGIRKNRQLSQIKNSSNISDVDAKKFKEHRGVVTQHKLVTNHPLEVPGVFFPPYEIVNFYKDNNVIENAENLHQMIYNDLVLSGKYTYKHVWKPGDILLMDQVNTIHRRTKVLDNKSRELLRAAGWYKSNVRRHFDYVL